MAKITWYRAVSFRGSVPRSMIRDAPRPRTRSAARHARREGAYAARCAHHQDALPALQPANVAERLQRRHPRRLEGRRVGGGQTGPPGSSSPRRNSWRSWRRSSRRVNHTAPRPVPSEIPGLVVVRGGRFSGGSAASRPALVAGGTTRYPSPGLGHPVTGPSGTNTGQWTDRRRAARLRRAWGIGHPHASADTVSLDPSFCIWGGRAGGGRCRQQGRSTAFADP